VSTQIRFQKVIGEKQLLELINAFVSHEMRNPLNCINAIILKMKMLVENFYADIAVMDGN